MTTAFIGQPVSRVDGRQKVTGAATYAAEFDQPGQAYGVIVRSTVANGRIASMDSTAAQRASGVLAVLTHRNASRLAYRPHKGLPDPATGERLHVLQDDRVNHQGQPIALVIAELSNRRTTRQRWFALRTRTKPVSPTSAVWCRSSRPSRRLIREKRDRLRPGAAIRNERSRQPKLRWSTPT